MSPISSFISSFPPSPSTLPLNRLLTSSTHKAEPSATTTAYSSLKQFTKSMQYKPPPVSYTQYPMNNFAPVPTSAFTPAPTTNLTLATSIVSTPATAGGSPTTS